MQEIAHIDYSDIFQIVTVETRHGREMKLKLVGWGDEAPAAIEVIRKHMISPRDPFT